jgi:hypothetical protein
MAFGLTYKLDDAGWATVVTEDGDEAINLRVSYLNDSLLELAEAATAIRDGQPAARVVFMDEPGEAQLIVSRDEDGISYELLWYDDWCSWRNAPDGGFELLLRGKAPEWEFLMWIEEQLREILVEHGEEGYRKKWLEHPFPMQLDTSGNLHFLKT